MVNIDWPSRTGLTAAQQQAELIGWLDDAVRQNHNAVVLQVRPTADAFWPSKVEPWSQYLTGQQGGNPGYDPLAFAVAEAHKRNLELHAWFNPYRLSMGTDLNALVPEHPARQHPDWVVTYGGKLYYNPGIPAVRKLVEDAIMDAVSRYDIDGVHFDDYFYPYPGGRSGLRRRGHLRAVRRGLPDAGRVAAEQHQPADPGAAAPDQGGQAVGEVRHLALRRLAQRCDRPARFDTTAGVQTYDDLAADTRRWVREEWIDYIVPQVYWAGGFAPADYNKIVPWWAEQVRGTDVHLYIGEATYKVGTSTQSPDWSDPAELSDHLAFDSTIPEVKGNIYFSAKDVRADRLGATSLLNSNWYTRPALGPGDAVAGLPPTAAGPVVALATASSTGVQAAVAGRPQPTPRRTRSIGATWREATGAPTTTRAT